jgi:hypothetical protein
LEQEIESLAPKLGAEEIHSRDVAAWPIEAGN